MTGRCVLLLFTINAILDISLSQTITPKQYNESENHPSCKDGFLSDFDTMIFKYEVDLTNDIDVNSVYFHTKKENEDKYDYLCLINITADCTTENRKAMCSCRTVKEHIIEITVRLKALSSLNGAFLRGNIVTSKNSLQIRSEPETRVPKIYDSNITHGYLAINKKEIKDEEICFELVKGKELFIAYSCMSQGAPCVIEISTNQSAHMVHGDEAVTLYETLERSQDITATIKSAACTLSGKIRIKKCYIRIEINEEKQKGSPDIDMAVIVITIISTVFFMIMTSGIIFTFLLLRRKIIERTTPNLRFRSRKKAQEEDEEEQLIMKEDLIEATTEIYVVGDNNIENPLSLFNESFIAKNEFTPNSLAEYTNDEVIFELINTMTDLTVMLTFSNQTNEITIGTGWVGYIVKYEAESNSKCTCNECQSSPSDEWGYITIYTSTDVVPANSGGMQVKCTIMLELEQISLINLTGYEVETKFSKSRIKFKTCNKTLLNTLDTQRQKINDLNYRINNKYKKQRDASMISNDGERLVIIVSYIPGLNKCISLGSWTHRSTKINKILNIEITRYTYTNPTCPGSAGAYVYILGRAHCGWLYQHYHVGINALQEGYCGYGIDAM